MEVALFTALYLNRECVGTLADTRLTTIEALPYEDLLHLFTLSHTEHWRSLGLRQAGFAMADARIDFDINDALKQYLSDPSAIHTPEAPAELVDCEGDPESLNNAIVNEALNPVVDAIAENPEFITRAGNLDTVQWLLKCAPITPPDQVSAQASEPDCELFKLSRSTSYLPPSALSKILDVLTSGISVEADLANGDLEADDQDSIAHHKLLLEVFAFLLQWTIAAVETKAAEKPASSTAPRGKGKGNKKAGSGKDGVWDSSAQLQTALDIMSKVLKLKLARIFVTTSERDTFIGMFTRPVYLVMESETRMKSTAIRMHCFRVLCIAVKHHGHAFGIS